jgi:GNAT superfamily N-acetyltransferase
VTEDFSAAALWLAPDAGSDEQAMTTLIEDNVAPAKKGDIAAIIEEMAGYHPEEPHWYLPFIGVDPAWQSKGLGSLLMLSSLARCDVAQLPAYLESTNPRNRPFYERHGFEALGEIRVGDCPPIVPMLRQPRPVKPT